MCAHLLLLHVEHGHMPAWAQDDPHAYWQAADAHERANGRLYSEVQFALPRELDAGGRRELPSTEMEPQEELQQLLARQAALTQELAAKKKALQEAQRRQRTTLTRQIRRAQARLPAAARKRRTRRLILLGSTGPCSTWLQRGQPHKGKDHESEYVHLSRD